MRGLGGRLLIVAALAVFALASPASADVRRVSPVHARGSLLTFHLHGLKTTPIRSAELRLAHKRRALSAARVQKAARRGTLRVRLPKSWMRTRYGVQARRHAKHVRLVLRIDSARTPISKATTGTTAPASAPRVYAYYYLWWSTKHWHDKLGSSYPYTATPLPLPATLDAGGCSAVSLFSGNQLTDVPPALFSQDDPGVIERDVRTAAAAGLAGFLVNWAGTGTADQTVTSIGYSKRLDALFQAVRKVNAEGIQFKIWISYKSSSKPAVTSIVNDLAYLKRQYGNDAAYDHSYSSRPTLVWTGSRKYARDDLHTISDRFRSSFFLIGDENQTTWSDGRSAYLDGDSYYWSSQNPYSNPQSFTQLASLASKVRASGANPDGSSKAWFAPLAPGYNSQLLGRSTCVPRNDGQTMRLLFNGNSGSNPDGWTLISWNEVSEGSYVEPLERYGSRYLDVLSALIRGA